MPILASRGLQKLLKIGGPIFRFLRSLRGLINVKAARVRCARIPRALHTGVRLPRSVRRTVPKLVMRAFQRCDRLLLERKSAGLLVLFGPNQGFLLLLIGQRGEKHVRRVQVQPLRLVVVLRLRERALGLYHFDLLVKN